jgi:hypothetical protein
MKPLALVLVALLICAGAVLAQRFRYWRGGERWISDDAPVRTAREVPSHSTDTPTWTNAPGLEKDVFTFVRVRYQRDYYGPISPGGCSS